MRLAEEYVRLRLCWQQRGQDEAFHVTMAELAAALCCTSRNARLITSRLMEAGWIVFVSGRGRGHTSVLTFCRPLAQVVLDEAKERVQHGDVPGAFDWLHQPGVPVEVQSVFMDWLGSYFGYQGHQRNQDSSVLLKETLRLPIYRPIVCLDPADAVFAFDTQLIYQVYSRLVEYDVPTDSLQPGIAHHWEGNADATRWSFYLHKHVRFHNDRLLTADDVVASLQRLMNGTYAHRWLMQTVNEIHAVHPHKVIIELNQPNRLLPLLLSHSGASIVPAGIDAAETIILPIGTGSYRLNERTAGRCVLERFDSYYGQGALLDEIEILIVPEQEMSVSSGYRPGVLTVLTGEFDTAVFDHLPRQETPTGVSMLMLNRRYGILAKDEALRQAFCYGVDRLAMMMELGDTYGMPATGLTVHDGSGTADHLPPMQAEQWHKHALRAASLQSDHTNSGKPLFADDPFPIETDIQYAIQQVQQSAYDGSELHLYTFQRHERAAYWLRDAYAAIGIRLSVQIVPWSELNSESVLAKADLLLFEAVVSGGLYRQLEYIQSSNSLIRRLLPDDSLIRLQTWTDRLLSEHDAHNGMCDRYYNQQQQLADIHATVLDDTCLFSVSDWLDAVHDELRQAYSCVFLTERTAAMVFHPSLCDVQINERGWVDFGRLWFREEE
ncbi:ABC transporter substrate-binding protein [Paenibacillus sp. WLX1005]|uniref:ABC transporter substrate-binding protein n=1 Tax=Paenibacillus sp. WLX1005 TaxID=3243766 RepID=UPI00398422D6